MRDGERRTEPKIDTTRERESEIVVFILQILLRFICVWIYGSNQS